MQYIILMAYCKTAVFPLLMHYRYYSFALSHQYNMEATLYGYLPLENHQAISRMQHAESADMTTFLPRIRTLFQYQDAMVPYRNFHPKDNTVSPLPYLCNGNAHTCPDYCPTDTGPSVLLPRCILFPFLSHIPPPHESILCQITQLLPRCILFPFLSHIPPPHESILCQITQFCPPTFCQGFSG